ncbi:MAG: pseudouridine synthase [Nonlabens sp.]
MTSNSFFKNFKEDISAIPLPEKFTFPFYYEPHLLAEIAAKELREYLDRLDNWFYDLKLGPENYQHPLGKMFGVLVVENEHAELGYLTAFSGVRTGKQEDDYFVPLVFDMFGKHSLYYKKSEELNDLNDLNDQIDQLHQDPDYQELKNKVAQIKLENDIKLTKEKKKQKKHREMRRAEREQSSKSPDDALIAINAKHKRQSMASKFLLKEYAIYLNDQLKIKEDQLNAYYDQLKKLKHQRKELSNHLQKWIFKQYKFLNANGDTQNALELFKNRPPYIPPSGTGDCAAPKLLQSAYKNDLKPIALAEFWYGESLRSQIRKHGHFYPSCRSKCEPVLNFMIQGLDVDPNPMLENPAAGKDLPFIYEDEHLFAVNKPAEFLSVKGKVIEDSVEARVIKKFPEATGPLLVHRLDMSTSGILVGTKSLKAHKLLQEQFERRTVSKKYIAILEGVVPQDEGFIDLPLRVDLDNRPFQMVDHEHGKNARTRFQVLDRENGQTKIAFYPITGRTHQLRVHAAHPFGLNCPIKGDDLYGKRADRLYLNATEIEFVHPITKATINLKVPAPF